MGAIDSQGEFGGYVARWGPNILASGPGTSMFVSFGMYYGTLDPKMDFGNVSYSIPIQGPSENVELPAYFLMALQ